MYVCTCIFCTYIRTFGLAELHATAHMQALTIGEFEGWKCGRECFLHQVVRLLLGPALVHRLEVLTQRWHDLELQNFFLFTNKQKLICIISI